MTSERAGRWLRQSLHHDCQPWATKAFEMPWSRDLRWGRFLHQAANLKMTLTSDWKRVGLRPLNTWALHLENEWQQYRRLKKQGQFFILLDFLLFCHLWIHILGPTQRCFRQDSPWINLSPTSTLCHYVRAAISLESLLNGEQTHWCRREFDHARFFYRFLSFPDWHEHDWKTLTTRTTWSKRST